MINNIYINTYYKTNNINFKSLESIKSNKDVTKDKIKVSVIVPIYNQERYLEKALNSLQNQTLQETEFICINDGSEDNSLNILEQYAQKDKRIKIIDQKNQGVGRARNRGVKLAQGEYIAFLDPDDWFESNALKTLYIKAKKQNSDFIVFNFNRIDDSGNLLDKFNLKRHLQRFYNISETENFHWTNIKPKVLGGLFPAAWNKFYRTDFVKKSKLHFAQSNLAEDTVFVFGATLNAENIGYSDECFYNYVVHNNSALRNCSDKNLCLFRSIDSVKKLIANLGLTKKLEKEFDTFVTRFITMHTKQMKSIPRLLEICEKKLTPQQNKMIKDRYLVYSELISIVNSLLTKK